MAASWLRWPRTPTRLDPPHVTVRLMCWHGLTYPLGGMQMVVPLHLRPSGKADYYEVKPSNNIIQVMLVFANGLIM